MPVEAVSAISSPIERGDVGPISECPRDNIAWLLCLRTASVRTLPRGLSDHTPLLLQNNMVDGGMRPFWFINAWMAETKNVRMMVEEWLRLKENNVENSLTNRLKSFKGFLRDSNISSFGDVDHEITRVTKLIEDLDNVG
ncbi:hypothetical protein V6N11_064745 [Hibiscus sabdariffa]|uniref:Reverse transcriptase n=1 Tax=Hibiscus sabdariffa TaxID=183260 RepID=A0ABR2SI91_9ROSI